MSLSQDWCQCSVRIKSEEEREEVLGEAERRLEEVKTNLWVQVAKELGPDNHYQFLRAYSPGLQEWVEALSFYHFLRYNKIISFQETQDQLRFTGTEETEDSSFVTVPQSEYVLGLADLTGEMMRNAINALGAGEMEVMKYFDLIPSRPINCRIFRSVSLCLRFSRVWPRVSADWDDR